MTDFERMGEQATHEARVAAGRAAIRYLFGARAEEPGDARFMTAVNKLEAFAGEEAWLEAADQLDIMNLPEEGSEELLAPLREEVYTAFKDFPDVARDRVWRDTRTNARKNVRTRKLRPGRKMKEA